VPERMTMFTNGSAQDEAVAELYGGVDREDVR
jgi:hypothetical protein